MAIKRSLFISNFKYVKICKIFLFIILTLVTNVFIGLYYESTSKKNIIEQHVTKRFSDFHELPEKSLDMIFIGSSHSYTTFDPEIFDKRLNINSFQMGAPAQQADSTYYMLLEILNYQQPKTVIYEYYWNILRAEPELGQAKTALSFIKSPKQKEMFLRDSLSLSEGNKVKNSMKTIYYQQDYFIYMSSLFAENISSLKSRLVNKGEHYYRSKGFVYCDYIIPEIEFEDGNHFKNIDGNDIILKYSQLVYVQKIIDLCKSNNIELIFVTAPLANVTMERHIKNYDAIYNTMAEMPVKNNIEYIDYNIINSQEQILKNENFRDDNHLNYSGAVIVSNHFIDNYILKHLL